MIFIERGHGTKLTFKPAARAGRVKGKKVSSINQVVFIVFTDITLNVTKGEKCFVFLACFLI